ncbi:hypothetical protein GW7_01678 [Heterocephalus glaber]|uniref:Uncharacterized protein n=1 Tax=Heterocephalus glaber TaxID=10181 RepID=G5C2X3_HETGA|nr:hypothetical protein GW7_01678 [Heterocephalus glaber]
MRQLKKTQIHSHEEEAKIGDYDRRQSYFTGNSQIPKVGAQMRIALVALTLWVPEIAGETRAWRSPDMKRLPLNHTWVLSSTGRKDNLCNSSTPHLLSSAFSFRRLGVKWNSIEEIGQP